MVLPVWLLCSVRPGCKVDGPDAWDMGYGILGVDVLPRIQGRVGSTLDLDWTRSSPDGKEDQDEDREVLALEICLLYAWDLGTVDILA